MKRLSKLFSGAGLLAVSMVIAKLLGALYRIPLTNVLGGEGMGLYQMVFPLYTLLITLSSGGFPVAISRLVAVKLSNGDERGAKKVLNVCLITLTSLGAVGSLLLTVLSRRIATAQGNSEASLAYLAIAPAVTAVGILSCYRGYYQGRENMLPSGLSQLVEQAGKLIVGLTLARVLSRYGTAYAVMGALLGVTASEIIATLFITSLHFISQRRRKRAVVSAEIAGDMTAELSMGIDLQSSCAKRGIANPSNTASILKSVFSLALPVTFGALVMPLTQVVDSVLIINVLTALGSSRQAATMAYGLVSGAVMTLVNMPVVVISAFSMVLLPKIARCCAQPSRVKREAAFSLKLCLALGVMMTLFIAIYARDLIELLYSRGLTAKQIELSARLLTVNSLTVFFVTIVQVATATLQGVNQAKKPAVNLAIGGVSKIAVTAMALPIIGIYGAVVGSVACYAVTAILDVIALRKSVGVSLKGNKWISLVIGGGAFAAISLTIKTLIGGLTGAVVSVVIAAVTYLLCLVALQWLSRNELRRIFPFFARKKRKADENC